MALGAKCQQENKCVYILQKKFNNLFIICPSILVRIHKKYEKLINGLFYHFDAVKWLSNTHWRTLVVGAEITLSLTVSCRAPVTADQGRFHISFA